MKAPGPCPFCGASLEARGPSDTWAHGKGSQACVLDGFGIAGAANVSRWNLRAPVKLIPKAEYHEDMGDVLWWFVEDGQINEPPYCGSPNDLGDTVELHTNDLPGRDTMKARIHVGGWPDYHTHFSLLPRVVV